MNCRPIFLILFVLSASAVVVVDRYITNDAVRLCREGNTYNLTELAQIRETQNAQVIVGEHLRAIRVLSAQLDAAISVGSKLAANNAELQQENQCLYESIKILNDSLNGDTVPTPAKDTPKGEDRAT